MTTTTATHRPINLAGLRWIEDGRTASFASSRPGYGVEVIATGEVLTSDGVQPSVWRTRDAAATIAQYATGMTRHTTMAVYRKNLT